MASNLSLNEIQKRPWRIEVFANKIWNTEIFLSYDNREFVVEDITINGVVFSSNKKDDKNKLISYLLTCKSNSKILLKGVYLDEMSGYTLIFSSKLVKTKEFGGFGKNGLLNKELYEIERLNRILQNKKTTNIKIGKTIFNNISYAKQGKITNKADIELVNNEGLTICWISHKDYTFQQWGGVKKYSDNAFVQEFVIDVKDVTGSIMPRATTFGRVIPEKYINIKYESVFGTDYYSYKYSSNNVNCVCIGNLELIPYNSSDYILTSKTMIFPETMIIEKRYDPIITATYKGDRSNFGILGARFDIQSINNRKWIDPNGVKD